VIVSESQIALDPVAEFAEASIILDRFYADQYSSDRNRQQRPTVLDKVNETLHRVHQCLALTVVREAENGIDKQLVLVDNGKRRAPASIVLAILINSHDLDLRAFRGEGR
jgi:hypothetical protein